MSYRVINPSRCVHGVLKRGKKAPRRNVHTLNRRLVTVNKFKARGRALGVDTLGFPIYETAHKERQYHFTKGKRERHA